MTDSVADFSSYADAALQRRTILMEEALTDRGNARRLAALHSGTLRWVPERRCWAHYDGACWVMDADECALGVVQSLSDAMFELRADVPDGQREKFLKEAIKLQGVKPARGALEAAKPLLLAPAKSFDAKPHLLNCPNGTLDLRTLDLRKHDPVDRLSLKTAAPYDPKAQLDLWQETLEKAIPDDETRDYFQKCVGVSLAGDVHLDLLFFIYGITRTGKGTLQGSIAAALGDYAVTAGLEDLAARDRVRAGPRPELVRLIGRRWISIYETGRDLNLDAALVKTLAGSDPVTVRDLYARPVTFKPQFTIWIASNYRPGLPADDDAVWERMREMPFSVQIPEDERDPNVRATLNDPGQAGAAVLAWAVQGLSNYWDRGLDTPTAVAKATKEYRDQVDHLAEFADDCLIFGDGYQATPMAIRSEHGKWRKRCSADVVSGNDLKKWLESRGCVLEQSKGTGKRRLWIGVGVVHDDTGESPR